MCAPIDKGSLRTEREKKTRSEKVQKREKKPVGQLLKVSL